MNLSIRIELLEDKDGKPYTVVAYYGGDRFGAVQDWCRKHGITFTQKGPDREHDLVFMTQEQIDNLRCNVEPKQRE